MSKVLPHRQIAGRRRRCGAGMLPRLVLHMSNLDAVEFTKVYEVESEKKQNVASRRIFHVR